MSGNANTVQQQLAPMAAFLGDYALVVSEEPEQHGLIPAANSLAMDELSEEHRFCRDGWEEPVRNAHSYGQLLMASLADHLAAMGAVAQHTVIGPSHAHLTLVRAIMEISTQASWLMEPKIGIERRIKRSLTYRIDSADNLKRQRSGTMRAEAQAARARARATVDALGWSFVNGAVAGERLPHAKRDFSRYAFPEFVRDSFDDMLWNLASAGGHGTFYAVALPLREPSGHAADPLDPRGPVRAVVTSAEQVATHAAIAYFGVKGAADARRELMGWPLTPTIAGSHNRGASLAKGVKESLDRAIANEAATRGSPTM